MKLYLAQENITEPVVFYELLAEFNEGDTKTIFTHELYTKCHNIITELQKDAIPSEVDLTPDEKVNIKKLYILLTLQASKLSVLNTPYEDTASSTLEIYEVK